ncbi:MAG TPA: DUF1003 domain-containing protein [Caulobacteraceae bacterium]|jgi:uncharacterized membrane protein|nr:DUF1003 domain-containing protein [Caulobacteraceae bacterium]
MSRRANESEIVRDQMAQELLGCPYEGLTPVQRSVIDLIASAAPTGKAPILKADDRSFGERLADQVASMGGSWGFIISFGVFLALWIGVNVALRASGHAPDPYPFIFLNLMLSMLAAIQAPVIMMSQNRQSNKDREAAEHDYIVNLRAELEIMRLHDKLDELRSRELEEMVKRQNETLELLRKQIKDLSGQK